MKTTKTTKARRQRPKREFNIVTIGQFRTLAKFYNVLGDVDLRVFEKSALFKWIYQEMLTSEYGICQTRKELHGQVQTIRKEIISLNIFVWQSLEVLLSKFNISIQNLHILALLTSEYGICQTKKELHSQVQTSLSICFLKTFALCQLLIVGICLDKRTNLSLFILLSKFNIFIPNVHIVAILNTSL